VSALGRSSKKKFRIGNIKKATAKTPGTNTIIYEMIYLEIIDNLETDVINGDRTYTYSVPASIQTNNLPERVSVNQGRRDTIDSDITDNNIVYPTFVKNTSGNTSVFYTSNNNLTYNSNTGALNVVQLNISPNTSIMGGVNTEIQVANTILDSFSVDTYRSAFYQIQINHLLEFHILNLNIVHDYPGTTVYSSKYGEVITNVSLGEFYPTVNLTSGMVEVHFSPTYPTQTGVTFSKTMLAKFGLTVPVGDLGYVNDPVTISFDAGFDSDPAVANFDYGTVP
jgi:hypothetical protein